jgi:FtsP/CotA-like multicopper oxidase with cupredoxin domain
MERRTFITLSASAALSLLTGCGGSSDTTENGNTGGNTTQASSKPLPIPELLAGEIRNGVKHFDLTIQEATHEFFTGIQTSTWGINTTYLGPTLLMRQGESISVNYTNQLSEPTTMHGHGMHVPGEMDGTAHQPIAVGSTWSAQYTVNQNACTNWYHPHYMHKTAPHVYQGLAGMIFIEDNDSDALDLPKRYGIDDIPLVLQDRFFSTDKTTLVYNPSNMQLARGYIGDTFITNGAISPYFEAEAKELRLRILNGSNSTMYELGFDDNRIFYQIATDNAFLEQPVSMNRLTLSPGERAEIIVDLSNELGNSLTLKEYRHSKTFLTINVSKDATASTTLPSTLITHDPLPSLTNQTTRQFTLGMQGMGVFTINGQTMDPNRIDVALSQGDVEEWEIINNMNMDHNFHIHGTHFRVTSRNNDPAQVLDNEKGYKDVVYLPANSRVKFIVAVPADGITADSNNPYMFHCHFLEHEDNGMMGQYTVS